VRQRFRIPRGPKQATSGDASLGDHVSSKSSTFLAIISGYCNRCEDDSTHALHVKAGDEHAAAQFVLGLVQSPNGLGQALGFGCDNFKSFEFESLTVIPFDAVNTVSALNRHGRVDLQH
jgi:hypothetical protein